MKKTKEKINHLYFGKSCEHRVFAALLKNKCDVYFPLLDNKGIDCVVKKPQCSNIQTVQIKSKRSNNTFKIGFKLNAQSYCLIPPDNKMYIVPKSIIKHWLTGSGRFKFDRREINKNDFLFDKWLLIC